MHIKKTRKQGRLVVFFNQIKSPHFELQEDVRLVSLFLFQSVNSGFRIIMYLSIYVICYWLLFAVRMTKTASATQRENDEIVVCTEKKISVEIVFNFFFISINIINIIVTCN
jgi:hypothetical protein